jgi:hypothetical protein
MLSPPPISIWPPETMPDKPNYSTKVFFRIGITLFSAVLMWFGVPALMIGISQRSPPLLVAGILALIMQSAAIPNASVPGFTILFTAQPAIAAFTRCTVLDPTPHSRAVLRIPFPLASEARIASSVFGSTRARPIGANASVQLVGHSV